MATKAGEDSMTALSPLTTALRRLVSTLPGDERQDVEQLIADAEYEQAELLTALRVFREIAEPYTVKPTIERVDALLARFPEP